MRKAESMGCCHFIHCFSGWWGQIIFRRMSETPTTTTSQESIAIHTSNLNCKTPPICIAVLSVPLRSEEGKHCQYSSHLYRSTPPICIAIRLPFVSQYFWENPGGCGHRVACSNALFLNTSVLTTSLLFRANSTCKGSRTPRLVEHSWVSVLGASCSNRLSVGTLRPTHFPSF